MKFIIKDRVVLLRAPDGPLAPYIASFSGWITRKGYALSSLRGRIRIAVGFSRWLADGSLSVLGKGGRRVQLPLPKEVGEAIAAYLQYGRPRSSSRRVFLRAKAPIRGFLGPSTVGHRSPRTLACGH
jgi:hypothetical protein